MKKILILTSFGTTDAPEETKLLHLYLCSLKRHVLPHYDVKVVLLNNFKIESSETCLTSNLVKEYGLEDVVIVKSIYDMGLSQKAISYLVDLGWYLSGGAKLNLLFDYAEKHNFFDADWLFWTDSDGQFEANFHELLEAYDTMPVPQRLITIAGDTQITRITHKGNTYVVSQNDRVNLYDDDSIPSMAKDATKRKITKHPEGSREDTTIRIYPQKLKVRNDFVGMDKHFFRCLGKTKHINWLFENYPEELSDANLYTTIGKCNLEELNTTDVDSEFLSLLNEMGSRGVNFDFSLDKGGFFEFTLKTGSPDYYPCARFEVPIANFMWTHFGGGWNSPDFSVGGVNLINASTSCLPTYPEYADVWKKDWPEL